MPFIVALLTVLLAAPAISDRGVFSDLDPQISSRLAPWLPTERSGLVRDVRTGVTTLHVDGLPVLSLPPGAASPVHGLVAVPMTTRQRQQWGDRDRDGIPDAVDVLRGARKTALNGAAYREGYIRVGYPGGDVPRDRGVCTDVVVRALRNAGLDLQRAVYEDMQRAPRRYGLAEGRGPNRNIEHRRVRRLIHYFRHRFRALPTKFDPEARGEAIWLPGDIVFMDTFVNKPGPDHIGIVGDTTDDEGRPLIVNNWTTGYTTRAMALLGSIPVTHRFRLGGVAP